MRAAVATVETEQGAVGTLVNNAGYAVQRRDRGHCRWTRSGTGVRDQRVRLRPDGAARAARHAAGRRDGSSTSVPSPGGSRCPGRGHTRRPSTPSRRSATRCGSRSEGSASTSIVIEPGPISTAFTATANAAIPPDEDGPYGTYHEAVAKSDAETDESFLAGTPEQVAEDDRACDHGRPAEAALPGDADRPRAPGGARDTRRPRVRRVPADRRSSPPARADTPD